MVASSINSLLADQLELAERIQSIIRNYKKDPRGRKSKPGYYKERLTKLELLWDTFFAGENQVQHAIRGMQIEHKYFRDDVFTKTKNVLVETKTEFAKNLNLLEKDTSTGSPKTGDIKLKFTSPVAKKIKLEAISPIKQDIKFESMSPINGDIKLKSNSPVKGDITWNSMFREQQVLMDRLDIIINEMSAETRVGLNPMVLPYLTEMKNMHVQLCEIFKDCQ